YFYVREGLFTAAVMFVNVFLAGLLTFNFFEPLADSLGALFTRTFLKGYEDLLALLLLFCICLIVLRAITNKLSDETLEFPGVVPQLGGGLFGLLTGYLLAGFLVCVLETLPWGQHFLDFEPRAKDESAVRRLLPPDRVWLALMSRAGAYTFCRAEEPTPLSESPYDAYKTFDPAGAFESNYLRLRRFPDR